MYPAGIPGMETRYVTMDDGISVRVVHSGPPSEHAIVLVHGWASCLYSFSETIPALASAGHRVLAMDLPGYGLSDKPSDESRYTTRAMSEVVRTVVKAMGVRRYTLMAHSMGGAIALDIATVGDPGLERLILVNAVGLGSVPVIVPLRLFSPRIVDRFTPRMITRPLVRLVLRSAYGMPERPTARDVDEYFAPSQFDEYAWACRATAHQANWRQLPATKLRAIRIPVLVITGGRDLLLRGAAKRAAMIPNARILTIPEAGHLVMQECSSKTNREILDFLRPVGQPRGRRP